MCLILNVISLVNHYFGQIKDYARAIDIKNQCKLLMHHFDDLLFNMVSQSFKQQVLDSKYIVINEKLNELNFIIAKYSTQTNGKMADGLSKDSILEDKICCIRNEIIDEFFKLFLAH
ncbi:MAG: hypothetical protein ACP5OZ_04920 [Candidatus Woesearchaeota archaeon]